MSFFARIRPRQRPRDEDAVEPGIDLHPAEFLRRRSPDSPVLDVRTAEEFALGHLEGASSLDILEDRFLERLEDLGIDPDDPVYLYCRTGNRSGQAARILRQNGYGKAFNVGGLDELVREGATAVS